jgi:hypothetical protein
MQTTSYSSYLKRSLGSYDHRESLTVTSGSFSYALCCILFVFLCDTVMMGAEATETCRRIALNDRTHFIGVHLLVCYVSVTKSLVRMLQNHNTHTAHLFVP